MSKFIKGRAVILSLYDTSAYMPVACLTSNGISQSQEIIEGDANKCDLEPSKSAGAYTYEVNAEGLVLDSGDSGYGTKASYNKINTLWATARSTGATVTWKMSGVNGDEYGTAFITSLEINADAEGDATFSISMNGVGEILSTDPMNV